jgi:hypothetical protein
MLNKIKSFITEVVKSCIKGFRHLKIALGYIPDVIIVDDEEAFSIDGQEYLLSDEDTLDQVAVEISETTYKVCLATFLLIASMFLVNEFFFIILLVIEIGCIYFLLKYIYEAFFKEVLS